MRMYGVLCLQHGTIAGTTEKPYIQKNIKVNGLTRIFEPGTTSEKTHTNDDYSGAAARIAYMLTFTSQDTPSMKNRQKNGTQGALWNRIKSYYNAFPGEVTETFVDKLKDEDSAYYDWSKNEPNAVAIDNESTDYKAMMGDDFQETTLSNSGYQWREYNQYNYIIGPFRTTYTSYIGSNSGLQMAGLRKQDCTLQNSSGQAVDQKNWYFSNASGGNITIPTSGHDFYIVVSKSAIGTGGSLTVSSRRMNAFAEWYTMKCEDSDQKRLYLVYAIRKYEYSPATVNFSAPKIQVTKVDEVSGNPLNGMQFVVRNSSNQYITNDATSTLPTFGDRTNAHVFTTTGSGQFTFYAYTGTYTIQEVGVGNNWQYEVTSTTWTKPVTNGTVTVTCTNKKKYIRLRGRVWLDRNQESGKETEQGNALYDGANGVDKNMQGITVRLKDSSGNIIKSATTDANGEYLFDKVNRDYVSSYYVEFEYDGLTYQNVTPTYLDASNGSKAIESTRRDTFNANFATVEGNGPNNPSQGHTINSNGNQGVTLNYTNGNHISTLKNVEKTENNTTVKITFAGNYLIQARTNDAGFSLTRGYTTETLYNADTISNINLGVYQRTQPDFIVEKDLENVQIDINGKSYVYEYSYKLTEDKKPTNDDVFNVGVRFENSYMYGNYSVPIYRSDYEFKSADENDDSNELKVKMTYEITIINESTDVISQVNSLVDYYDSRYTLKGVARKLTDDNELDSTAPIDNNINGGQGQASNYNGRNQFEVYPNVQLDPNESDTFYVQFELNKQAVVSILNGESTLENSMEITSYSSFRDGKPYAGVDIDSNPGNADPTKLDGFEDDSGSAPSLLLQVTNAREMEGVVFEDKANAPEGYDANGVMTGQKRQGDGAYDSENEDTIAGVDVTLTGQNSGNVYKTKTVEEDGYYKFTYSYIPSDGTTIGDREESQYINNPTDPDNRTSTGANIGVGEDLEEIPEGSEITITPVRATDSEVNSDTVYTVELSKGQFYLIGYIPDDYTLTYTWGNDQYLVQNYKGTVYNQDRYNTNVGNPYWYRTEANESTVADGTSTATYRFTDALDDYTLRQNIDDKFKTINNTTNRGELVTEGLNKMDSTTPTMTINVGYDSTETDSDETRFTYKVANIDFGIIERAKQRFEVTKRVSHMSVALANGNTLVDFTIDDDGKLVGEHSNVTYMPPSNIVDPYNGFVRLEMDSELIQNAILRVDYKFTVENTGELDYLTQDYYWYGKDGTENDLVKITPSKMIDYLDNGWSFNAQDNSVYNWISTNIEANGEAIPGFILSDDVEDSEEIKNNRSLLFTDYYEKASSGKIELKPNDSSAITLSVAKILSTSGDINLENAVEVVEIQKTGGADVIEDITPGNYDPGDTPGSNSEGSGGSGDPTNPGTPGGSGDPTNPGTPENPDTPENPGDPISTRPGIELDDYPAPTIMITPNTGANLNYILPVAIGITAFIIVGVGIIFIKKKILNR